MRSAEDNVWRASWQGVLAVGPIFVAVAGLLLWLTVPASAAPDPTRIQLSTPTPTGFMRGNLLFSDDFATYSQRWGEVDGPKARAVYSDFAFQMQVASPGVSVWSVPEFEIPLHEFVARVDVAIQGGSADSSIGFIFDFVDDLNFKLLGLSLNGSVQFAERNAGEWNDLTPSFKSGNVLNPDRQRADAVIAPIQSGCLEMRVTRTEVSLRLDDELVWNADIDVPWMGGTIGLVSSAGTGFIDVAFDDMMVWHWVVDPVEE